MDRETQLKLEARSHRGGRRQHQHIPSPRVWVVVVHGDGFRSTAEDFLRREIRCVSATSGANLVSIEDDVLLFDPAKQNLVYATSIDYGNEDVCLKRAEKIISSTGMAKSAMEMVCISFRGGTAAARPTRGAAPIRQLLDRLACPRDIIETKFLCKTGFAHFPGLDGAVEGILHRSMADVLLKQNAAPAEILSHLARSQLAFARSWLTVPCKSVGGARQHIRKTIERGSQIELPLKVSPEVADCDVLSGIPQLGFASQHAIGLPIYTGSAPRRPNNSTLSRRTILGRVAVKTVLRSSIRNQIEHETFRPSVWVLSATPRVGRQVQVAAVLDGELPTALGLAGSFSQCRAHATLRLSTDAAFVQRPVVDAAIGETVIFRFTPESSGRYHLKLTCSPDSGGTVELSIPFHVA